MGAFMSNNQKILQELAVKRKSLIEAMDNEARIKLWRDVNDLKVTRPPVCIYQVPWSEISNREELVLQCDDWFLQSIEEKLQGIFSRLSISLETWYF
jgi:hypothetical protein